MMQRVLIWVALGAFLLPVHTLRSQEPITRVYKDRYAEATAALKEKNYDLALQKINEAEADTPGKIPTLELRGTIYTEQEKYDLAIRDFQAILAQYPDYPGALYNRGEVYFLKKEFPKSKEFFRKYLQLQGQERNALVRYKVFLCDLMAGNTGAVEAFLAKLKPTITHPLEYYCRAAVAYHGGDQAGGDDLLSSAFNIYPDALNLLFARSLENLGFITAEGIPQVERIDGSALQSLSFEFMPEGEESDAARVKRLQNQVPELE